MKKLVTMLFILFATVSINNSLIAQPNTVGLNSSFIYSSISAAYTAIGATITSPQLIELNASYTGSSEVPPILLNPITGASSTNTVTIRPAAGANGLILSGAVNDGIIRFAGCSFVFLDGRPGGVASTPANYLTINNTLSAGTFNSAHAVIFAASFNCKARFLNANCIVNAAGARGVISIGGSLVATSGSGNVIANNIVTGGQRGIQVGGAAGSNNTNDTVRNNDVSQYASLGIFGNLTTGLVVSNNRTHFTSLIATIATFLVGIQIQGNSTLVDQNEIDNQMSSNAHSLLHMANFGANNVITRNLIHDPVSNVATFNVVVGIQFSSSGTTTFSENQIYNMSDVSSGSSVFAINVTNNGTAADINNVTKNKIYNLSTTADVDLYGIVVSNRPGNILNLNNNFISITAPNNLATGIFGVFITDTTASTANIYFNSIRLGGVRLGGSLAAVNSVGIYKGNDDPGSTYRIKNNISINNRVTGDDSLEFHMASWISNLSGTLDIDYNDYYASDTSGGVAGGWRDSLYTNFGLTAYKAYASPNEAHTTFNNVNFVSNIDLHLTGASIGNGTLAGIPISGITTDIDNQIRSAVHPYRGADEAGVTLQPTLALTINFQAINVPPSLAPQDTISVVLKSTSIGHATIDSAVGLGGSGIASLFKFPNAADGVPYYIKIYHRSSIPTWSALTPSFSSLSASYDFTTAPTQAFGSNLVLVGGKWSLFTGDVIKSNPGVVNLTDISSVFNAAAIFAAGPYVLQDLNWNGVVNLADIVFVFNNSAAFVSEKFPTPGPAPAPNVNMQYLNDNSIPVSHKSVITTPVIKKGSNRNLINSGKME